MSGARRGRDAASRDAWDKAAAQLDGSWTGTHTVPAAGLYPHQWSWDSAFIAIGLRHVAPDRAITELETLFHAQWADGRLPQMVYDVSRDDDYSPRASFWRSDELPGAPAAATAGLVQPPVHAWAAWLVHTAAPELSRERGFLNRAYPRLVAWHEYLRTRRDRGGRGLAAVVHPWESGTDNSPLWDAALARVPDTPATEIHRPDLSHAGPGERPGAKEYARFYWLAEHYRDSGCDDADDGHPFVLEDPSLNALWARSELALAEIASVVGAAPGPHRERASAIAAALESLWDDELETYVARDVVAGTLARRSTVNGLVPLVLPDVAHAGSLVSTALGPGFLGSGAVLVPSYDLRAPDVDRAMYWRGPAWFNMTWLVMAGLRMHGRGDVADRLAGPFVEHAVGGDFPEYVDPLTGEPHGTGHFSWTAALTLDVLDGGPS